MNGNKSVDFSLKSLYWDIMNNGQSVQTRSGPTLSVFKRELEFKDVSNYFPAVTSKKLAFRAMFGELLWFLSGDTTLGGLRFFTHGDFESTKSTIWDADYQRWAKDKITPQSDTGRLYGYQWRKGTDQVTKVINSITFDPTARDHIICAWNPDDIANNRMALKPCHMMCQFYVRGDFLDLVWYQRSVDSFLGLPFNIASYATLLILMAEWTRKTPGNLYATLGDTHIYMDHIGAVKEYCDNPVHEAPFFDMSELSGIDLNAIQNFEVTADDLMKCVADYEHSGIVKAPLSVGN